MEKETTIFFQSNVFLYTNLFFPFIFFFFSTRKKKFPMDVAPLTPKKKVKEEEEEKNEEQEQPPVLTASMKVWLFILLVWAFLGVLAFITSMVCFMRQGTFMEKWVGFLTAIFTGPFYWLYFFNIGTGYCGDIQQQQQQSPLQEVLSPSKRKSRGLKKSTFEVVKL